MECGIFVRRRSGALLPGTTMLISEAYETNGFYDALQHTRIGVEELGALPAAASPGR